MNWPQCPDALPLRFVPLSEGVPALIRVNLEELHNGERARLVAIGTSPPPSSTRSTPSAAPMATRRLWPRSFFIGKHVYESRIVRDGCSVEDVIDQITSALSESAAAIATAYMTAVENPLPRSDRYGNAVRDRAIFECSARHPRPELLSVVPKGDRIKPKKPLND